METSQETNIKVPFISKLAYGFGDVGCNFSWMFVGNFRPGVKFCVSDFRQSQEWRWKAGRILA